MTAPTPLPTCTVTVPHEPHTTLLAGGGELVCGGVRYPIETSDVGAAGILPTYELTADTTRLTAAQEIRLALTLKAMDLAEKTTGTEVEADDEDIADFVRVVTGVVAPLATVVEHGDGMSREQLAAAMAERGIPEPSAACPDPMDHTERSTALDYAAMCRAKAERERNEARAQRDDYAARLVATDRSWALLAAERDDLRARVAELERLEAEARERLGTAFQEGFDAASAGHAARIDELERQRDAVLAYLDEVEAGTGTVGMTGVEAIRAIYAEHGDEERGNG